MLDKSDVDQAKAVLTSGSQEASTPATSGENNCTRTETIAGKLAFCQYMSEIRYDTTFATKK